MLRLPERDDRGFPASGLGPSAGPAAADQMRRPDFRHPSPSPTRLDFRVILVLCPSLRQHTSVSLCQQQIWRSQQLACTFEVELLKVVVSADSFWSRHGHLSPGLFALEDPTVRSETKVPVSGIRADEVQKQGMPERKGPRASPFDRSGPVPSLRKPMGLQLPMMGSHWEHMSGLCCIPCQRRESQNMRVT